MVRTFTLLWIFGLFTLVPYSSYYLLFQAQHDEYALHITLVLFWIFGYWGVAGPIISAWKIRKVFRALEQIGSAAELNKWISQAETEEAAIEMIAAENRIPKFLARRIYRHFLRTVAMEKGDL